MQFDRRDDLLSSYLVTGGAGFVGSNIVGELLERGERTRVVDNLSTGRRENIAGFLQDIEFIEGDIRDLETVRKVMKGVDYVLHQAALPSVPRSVKDPIATTESNINGTLNILIAARDAGVRKVVYASSSSVYGDTPILPKREDMKPNPLSPYAASKLTGEYYCKIFHQLFGLETVCLRYFNVFGPRQDPTSQYAAVIPRFMTAMQKGKPPVIYGDGEQTRDFTFVQNVVDANILACFSSKALGEIINIACGQQISLNRLIQIMNQILNTTLVPICLAPRPGDVRHSFADIGKAERVLKYRPIVPVDQGLEKLVQWVEINGESFREQTRYA